jgi:NMD protein affecting ribosome stability and mRNA decay
MSNQYRCVECGELTTNITSVCSSCLAEMDKHGEAARLAAMKYNSNNNPVHGKSYDNKRS